LSIFLLATTIRPYSDLVDNWADSAPTSSYSSFS